MEALEPVRKVLLRKVRIFQALPLFGDSEVAHLAGLMYEPGNEEPEDEGDDDGANVGAVANDLATKLKPALTTGAKATSKGISILATGLEKGINAAGDYAVKGANLAGDLATKAGEKAEKMQEKKDSKDSKEPKEKEEKKEKEAKPRESKDKKSDKKDKSSKDEKDTITIDWYDLDETNQTTDDILDEEKTLKRFANLKEIFIFRRRKVVHIYDVIEVGRRFYRSLVFSSDNRYAFRDITTSVPRDSVVPLDPRTKFAALENGMCGWTPPQVFASLLFFTFY